MLIEENTILMDRNVAVIVLPCINCMAALICSASEATGCEGKLTLTFDIKCVKNQMKMMKIVRKIHQTSARRCQPTGILKHRQLMPKVCLIVLSYEPFLWNQRLVSSSGNRSVQINVITLMTAILRCMFYSYAVVFLLLLLSSNARWLCMKWCNIFHRFWRLAISGHRLNSL